MSSDSTLGARWRRTLHSACSPLIALAAGVLPITAVAHAQATPSGVPASPGLITIRLEKQAGDRAQAVPQNTVFKNGDVLRFRLTSGLTGYLYVVDKGTSGTTSTLFPGSGSDNHVAPTRAYLVPADGEGWFEVSGPPGFDILYFLVSESPLSLPAAAAPQPQSGHKTGSQAAPAPPALSPDLLPRCNDEVFKSRGECLDDSAGPAPLARDAVLPREIMPLAGDASRDIVLSEDGDQTTVRPAPHVKLPVIYTFRLAHH